MIINYDNDYPDIPKYEDGGIDWLAVKSIAKQQNDWFARGASIMPLNQRLVNLYYFYAWMKYSGYAPIAMRALASMLWFECGYDGSQWGTGKVRSDDPYPGFDPVYDDEWDGDPESAIDHIMYYEGYAKIVAENWATLPETWPIRLTIPAAAQMNNPVIVTNPSYGLVQWTPYNILWEHSDLYGQMSGEDWSHAWLNDSSLQCFILDWEQAIADATPTEEQRGTGYKGEWINDRHVGDLDIIECTWMEWKTDHYFAETGNADDMFINSCHQFLVHYIHATPEQAVQADQARLAVLHTYLDEAFTVWDNAGGADIMDMPAPNTLLDPWHMMLWPALKERRSKIVRTILF